MTMFVNMMVMCEAWTVLTDSFVITVVLYSEHCVLRHMVGITTRMSGVDLCICPLHGPLPAAKVCRCAAPMRSALGKMGQSGGKTCTRTIQCVSYQLPCTYHFAWVLCCCSLASDR